MGPTSGDIVIGIGAVVLACLAAAAAVHAARRSRNWLYLICAVGVAAAVTGIVGQRAFPGEDAVRRLGRDAAGRQTPGPWDAGVRVPVVGLQLTPVTVGGLLVAVAGLSLVLFFEPMPVSVEEARRRERPRRRLEDDDAV